MKKKTISVLAIVTLLMSLLAACSGGDKQKNGGGSNAKETAPATTSASASEEPAALNGKITFATNRTDKADNTLKALADKFMAEHPGTTVEIEGLKDPGVLKTRAAAGELPDAGLPIPELAAEKFPDYYLPLDDLGFSDDNWVFYSTRKLSDGHVYQIAGTVGYDGIAYNKKAFAEAGIEAAPKTIEELMAAAEKLKAKGIVPVATSYKDGWPLNWYGNDWIYQTAMSGNPNIRNEVKAEDALISEGTYQLQAINFLRELVAKG